MLSFLISNKVTGLFSVQVLISLKEGRLKHRLSWTVFFHPSPNISAFCSSLRVRKYKKSAGVFKHFRCQIMSWMVIICDSIQMSLSVSSHSQDYPKDYTSLELSVSPNQKLQMKIRYLQILSQKLLQASLAFQTKAFRKQSRQYRGKLSRDLLIRKHQN